MSDLLIHARCEPCSRSIGLRSPILGIVARLRGRWTARRWDRPPSRGKGQVYTRPLDGAEVDYGRPRSVGFGDGLRRLDTGRAVQWECRACGHRPRRRRSTLYRMALDAVESGRGSIYV